MTTPLDRQHDAVLDIEDGGFDEGELDALAALLDDHEDPDPDRDEEEPDGQDTAEAYLEVASAAEAEHTGGMIALLPTREHADLLTIPGGEPSDELHLTLAYLGDDVTWLRDDPDVAEDLIAAVQTALADTDGPLQARVFAHTTFNADGGPDGGRDQCAVYGIGDTAHLAPLRAAVLDYLTDVDGLTVPAQHDPFVPHVTAAYGRAAADLSYLGPVVFDRVVVALAGAWHVIPLTGATEAAPPLTEATAAGAHWPGWDVDRDTAAYYTAALLTALTAAVDPRDLARRALTTHPTQP